MSEPAIADTLLREHLPPAVVSLLTTDPPEQLSGSYVDEELSQHHSDLLFRVRLATGNDALAYLLVEHKSAPDPLARLQLLRYITRVLARWHKEHQTLPLPPVVPILVSQGPEGWTCSTDFSELYGVLPDALHPYLLSFRHALIDLAQIEDSALSVRGRPRCFFRAMKYIQREALPDHFNLLLLDAAALTKDDLITILVYLARGPVAVGKEIVQDAVNQLGSKQAEGVMESFGASFERKGFDRGVAEGKSQLLTGLLERRFGPLPSQLKERVSSADSASIEAWLYRAMDAPNLQTVFDT